MKKLGIFRTAALSLAVIGLMIPSAALGTSPALALPAQPSRHIADIALDEAGTLNGQVVDAQGRGVANVPVQIGCEGERVASLVSGSHGQFAAGQLSGRCLRYRYAKSASDIPCLGRGRRTSDCGPRNSDYRWPDHSRSMRMWRRQVRWRLRWGL